MRLGITGGILLILVIGLGWWRGKVRGISEELLDFLQWLVIIVAVALTIRRSAGQIVK